MPICDHTYGWPNGWNWDSPWVPHHFGCMDTSLNQGQFQQVGCEVGCWPCQDDINMQPFTGASIWGLRWIPPFLGYESRDAWGRRRPMVSGVPTRLARGRIKFLLAMCWDPFGEEDFDKSMCDCYAPGCPTVEECGDLGYHYPEGLRNTCWVHGGVLWPPSVFDCMCDHTGDVPLPVLFERESSLGAAAFVSTAEGAWYRGSSGPKSWCTSNLGVLCWGHQIGSTQCTPEDPWDPGYLHHYALGTDWRLWDWLRITEITAQFTVHDDAADEYGAATDARNAALTFVEQDRAQGQNGILRLDQLDSPRRAGSNEDNFNPWLTTWERTWNASPDPNDVVRWSDLPAVTTFPQSKLRSSGHAVQAEYVILRAHMMMSMVLHRLKKWDIVQGEMMTQENKRSVYPLVRVRIMLDMGVRVAFATGGTKTMVRPWKDPPDEVNLALLSNYANPFGRAYWYESVVPSPADEWITYIDAEGRTLTPPARIVWDGHLGFFSDPPHTDVFDYDYWDAHENTRWECCAIAKGLEGLIVPAMESHPDNDEGERRQIWEGHVQMRFPMEFSTCPE